MIITLNPHVLPPHLPIINRQEVLLRLRIQIQPEVLHQARQKVVSIQIPATAVHVLQVQVTMHQAEVQVLLHPQAGAPVLRAAHPGPVQVQLPQNANLLI